MAGQVKIFNNAPDGVTTQLQGFTGTLTDSDLTIMADVSAAPGVENTFSLTLLKLKQYITADVVSSLNDLSDVDLTGAVAGQFLQTNGTIFTPVTIIQADGSIGTHSDVSLAGLVDGNTLVYNAANQRFEPGAGGGVGLPNGGTTSQILIKQSDTDGDATWNSLSSDISITSSGVATISPDTVTYGKIQNVVANNVLLGNDDGPGSIVQELTATDVRTLLNVADGANNYVHPNHTGDVTSTGDGATVIANDAVTTAKILNSNVTTDKIADSNVTTAKIADLNVTTNKIAVLNVTTVKIANRAVTFDKFA